jgi:Cupin domain
MRSETVLGELAAAAAGNGRLAAVEAWASAGFMTPLHAHGSDEAVIVLEGSMTIFAGEDVVRLRPGETFIVAEGIAHAYRAEAPGDAGRVLHVRPVDRPLRGLPARHRAGGGRSIRHSDLVARRGRRRGGGDRGRGGRDRPRASRDASHRLARLGPGGVTGGIRGLPASFKKV